MLNNDLQRHADLHRALGFKFRTQYALLQLFVSHAEKLGDEFIIGAHVVDWAAQAPSPAQRRNRLLTVRRFALALRAEDPRHEVPSDNVFGHPERRRRKPYIYTPNEIAQLLAAATKLGPAASIKASIYETLFGLLAATGMRISEALALRLGDVTADGLLIRTTKFQKSRLLPLHSTTQVAIDKYLEIRAGVAVTNDHLFLSASFGPLPYNTAAAVFRRLANALSASEAALERVVPASTISGTHLRFARSKAARPTGEPSPVTWFPCQHTWDMPGLSTPIGISRLLRSC